MRAVTGLLPSAPGMVRLGGEAIGALPADAVAVRGIAVVPEGRRLFPSLGVDENLRIGADAGRAGPWTLDAVLGLFPALYDKRRAPPPRFRAGSSRWWPSGGRSWPIRASFFGTRSASASPP